MPYYLLRSVKPSRSKSGWDFVVEVGLRSVVCYAISHVFLWLFTATARSWPKEYPLDLTLGLFPVSRRIAWADDLAQPSIGKDLRRNSDRSNRGPERTEAVSSFHPGSERLPKKGDAESGLHHVL